MDSTVKKLLNDFSKSQPALQIPGEPADVAGIQLADEILAAAEDAATTAAEGATGSTDAPYTPGTPSNWDGNPATVQEALDRMAALLFTLNTNEAIP